MSDFELPWNTFVGFSLFTLEEDMIFDKVINTKTAFSTVYQVIDTSTKTREELKKSQTITLVNEVFRVDYHLFFNIVLACMFEPETDENVALEMIQIIKNKLIEQLQDYGTIEKMEPKTQTALIKRLGNLISERAASQVKYDYFPTKKPQEIVSEPVEQPRVVEEKPDYSQPTTPTQTSTPVTQAQGTGQVEDLLEYIGQKTEPLSQGASDDKKVELAQELLEQAKKDSIVKVISSIVKGLSTKTGVCFVFTGDKGALETITYGMSEKHAEFVLGILSKYPEVVKQTIESPSEEKTLDAGDGVVILEETESGMLVSITKNREEISIISKRMKLVTTLISEFLKPSF
ncbi:MAG: hypothetical protein KAU62_12505 [Candidatus Heimdallarchaeota archaeon]|nr:hypothetical protein [Candidatus Heimdallarchaeota archaeon]MCG3256907.1 hypothetical protein [Candidatus Heimdallarchaeota archaeon]MCK4611971.1 hypothetical protein [Candidatus Heimdallarchaeota archaeon]